MIHVLSLEPLKERYTSWWHEYIPDRLKKAGKAVHVIDGEALTTKVETGTVLDAAGTNYWKAEQLKRIARLFKEGAIKEWDQFLVTDIWFPGIEMIRYMSTLYKIPIRMWGVWHAGSSTNNDFAQPMHPWSKYFEIGFLNACDGVFVGSDYSKESILARLMYSLPSFESEAIANRIHAHGMPIDFYTLKSFATNKKENRILFPHRPDPEKGLDQYLNILMGLSTFWEDFEHYEYAFCTSKEQYKSGSTWVNALLGFIKNKFNNIKVYENLEKEEYYKLLGSSKLVVSTTTEENFGYCMVEALATGTRILSPNDYAHPEIVDSDERFLYNTLDDLLERIPKAVTTPIAAKELQDFVEPYNRVVETWAMRM